VVSASSDKTLKVWDFATSQCLATHRGDTWFTAVAATMTTICAGDAAGTLWLLDWPASLGSPSPALEPHAEPSPHKATTEHPRKRSARMPRDLILFLAASPRELALGAAAGDQEN
jgi:WD40 repeat protein